MNWLDELLKQNGESEAPERYFWWSGLAAISAVVRKNVWLERYYYKLYPNIYVALISSHPATKKGIPIGLCKTLLQEVDRTRIISGCNSIQGIIKQLGAQKTLGSGGVIGDAHAIILSDEFHTLLTEDPKALSILTGLYGTHEHEKVWEYTLKESQIVLKSPCLTMLVASNEMLFSKVITAKEIEGGFIGRIIMVKESGVRRFNSLAFPPKHKLNPAGLAIRLVEISKIRGEFNWSDEVRDLYDQWYLKMQGEDHSDTTGAYGRLGDQVLKVAMLISLSKKNELVLDWEDIELAIDKCEECAYEAAKTTLANEPSNGDRPNVKKLIMDIIVTSEVNGIKYRITKSMLLNKLRRYPSIHTSYVDICIGDYESAGLLEKKTLPGNGNINTRILITLTEDGALAYLRKFKVP